MHYLVVRHFPLAWLMLMMMSTTNFNFLLVPCACEPLVSMVKKEEEQERSDVDGRKLSLWLLSCALLLPSPLLLLYPMQAILKSEAINSQVVRSIYTAPVWSCLRRQLKLWPYNDTMRVPVLEMMMVLVVVVTNTMTVILLKNKQRQR